MPALKPDKIHNTKPTAYRWCRMFQQSFAELAKDRELKGNTWRVFIGLLSSMDFSNEVDITQRALAELTAMHQQDVSKALILLRRKGIITTVVKPNGRTVYQINDRYALKGDIRPVRLAQ